MFMMGVFVAGANSIPASQLATPITVAARLPVFGRSHPSRHISVRIADLSELAGTSCMCTIRPTDICNAAWLL